MYQYYVLITCWFYNVYYYNFYYKKFCELLLLKNMPNNIIFPFSEKLVKCLFCKKFFL
jgi:hypothetical protein